MLDKTTDPKREMIERLAAAKKSSTEIGHEMGMTRNAVIGYCKRRGIQLLGRPANMPKPKPDPSRPPPLRRIKNLFIPAKPARVPASKASPTPPQVVNDGAGVEIWDLKGGQCRWPLWGDNELATGFFCGAESETGHSWCPAHKRIVYAGSASALAAS